VMRGLRLLTFDPGDVIVLEGDPGDSLFVLTTGRVKAFVRTADAPRPRKVRELKEGEFFGEISILSGKPRTATVTCATRCELLELDRATLDDICRTHPKVLHILEDYYMDRAAS
jgi:cAMP-dependent protein kinase regulator